MKETPVNKIMESTLDKMRDMVDVSTIIGEPGVTGNINNNISVNSNYKNHCEKTGVFCSDFFVLYYWLYDYR